MARDIGWLYTTNMSKQVLHIKQIDFFNLSFCSELEASQRSSSLPNAFQRFAT